MLLLAGVWAGVLGSAAAVYKMLLKAGVLFENCFSTRVKFWSLGHSYFLFL
jgi:hypothetical protein